MILKSRIFDFWLIGKAISLRSLKKRVEVVLLYIGVVYAVRYGIESRLDPRVLMHGDGRSVEVTFIGIHLRRCQCTRMLLYHHFGSPEAPCTMCRQWYDMGWSHG